MAILTIIGATLSFKIDDLIKFYSLLLIDIIYLFIICIIACINTKTDMIKKFIIIFLGIALVITGAIYIYFL